MHSLIYSTPAHKQSFSVLCTAHIVPVYFCISLHCRLATTHILHTTVRMCVAVLHILHRMQHHLSIFLCIPEMQFYISAMSSRYFGPLLLTLSNKKIWSSIVQCRLNTGYCILKMYNVYMEGRNERQLMDEGLHQ